jgi:hypothetical protein
MEEYDPDHDLTADEWLDLDEQERIILVEDYHRRHRIQTSNMQRHALVHAIVENQLAVAEPIVVAPLARLRSEGVDRPDAIHAIGSVLSDQLDSLLRDPQSLDQSSERYYEALRKLSASKWKAAQSGAAAREPH